MKSNKRVDRKVLRAAGLDEQAIVSLATLKQSIAAGQRSELTRAHKYLLFGKYLLESRRLDEGAT